MDMRERLITALDFPCWEEAGKLVDELGDRAVWYKVGLELYLASGGSAVTELKKRGRKVFLDLKFYDIPNTVAGVTRQVMKSDADMFNVHASGGRKMMEAAAEEVRIAGKDIISLGVTVLTSFDEEGLRETGFSESPQDAAVRLALLCRDSGLKGVVCSPGEAASVKKAAGEGFVTVCPGIRPAGTAAGDQKRVNTPGDAICGGADYLVVGRPVNRAENPVEAFEKIIEEMEGAFNG